MDNYFKVLNTNKSGVTYNINRQKRTEEEQDEFLKEKYNDRIKGIKLKREIAIAGGNQERVKELEQEEKDVVFAYQQIKSMDLRNKLKKESEIKEQQTRRQKVANKKKSPYEILGALEDTLKHLATEEQRDDYIKNKRDKMIKACEDCLTRIEKKNFRERFKIETKMKEIEQAYEVVRTEEKRKTYRKEQEIEEKYSHAIEYDPTLIANRNDGKNDFLTNKMLTREERGDLEYLVPDKEDRKLRILKTAQVIFENSHGKSSAINEYQITREIDGEEKVDIIYTKLDLNYLKVKSIDPDCYDCVVNQLLAEDTIRGSKYNRGYIGEVEQDRKGNYSITLKNDKLSPKEQEQLTAVTILGKLKEQEKEEQEMIGEVS